MLLKVRSEHTTALAKDEIKALSSPPPYLAQTRGLRVFSCSCFIVSHWRLLEGLGRYAQTDLFPASIYGHTAPRTTDTALKLAPTSDSRDACSTRTPSHD
jgi:hypothetical protein